MATTEYATLVEAKDWLSVTSTSQDDNLTAALEAASRAIDGFCGRRFWIDDAASARIFTAEFGDLLYVPDIGSTSGLLVETDSTWDGTFDVSWTADARTGYGYRLEPVNALAADEAVEKRPYTKIRAIASSFPTTYASVQVTAIWGWPSVPADIHEGCLLLLSRLWKRKDAVLGVAGGQEVGFVELSRRIDPDIKRMLNPYRSVDVLAVGRN